jgi:hypothetical protein
MHWKTKCELLAGIALNMTNKAEEATEQLKVKDKTIDGLS